jgi:ankyrin repeat protein
MKRRVFWMVYATLAIVSAVSGVVLGLRPVRLQRDIHGAAREGDIARVREIISRSPGRVNARDQNEWTPLHCAVHRRRVEVARFLLGKGARLDVRTKGRCTPLHFAVGWGDPELTELLLTNGAGVNARGPAGRTPLHEAVLYDHRHIAERLLAGGADVRVEADDGLTPLQLAQKLARPDMVELLKLYRPAE